MTEHQTLTTAQGCFTLQRLPQRPRELLRAWDAADEYLVEYLAEQTILPNQRLLLVNDSFGALAVALHAFKPTAWSDSYLSQQATRVNLQQNQLAQQNVQFITSLQPLNGMFDYVLIKTPKTLALLEDQLIRLRPHLQANSQLIVAGLIKNMSSSIWTLLERILGTTTTSLAKKKARLIFISLDEKLIPPNNPYPTEYQLENTPYRLINHANVFSRERLDIGTRFLLQHLPYQTHANDIIDLACGNGVVGLIAAERNPTAKIHFVDESFMAIASAETNFYRAFDKTRTATFQVNDGLINFVEQSADLILCNPPFHQQHSIGDHIALSFFKQAKKVLRTGGQLWVIGNRHLLYAQDLKHLFGHCTQIASNTKFIIWQVVK